MGDKKHSFHKKNLGSSDNVSDGLNDKKKKEKEVEDKSVENKTEDLNNKKRNRKKKGENKKSNEEKTDAEKKVKQEEDHIEKELKNIYTDDSGSMPDMSSFQPQKGGGIIRGLLVLILSFMFLGGVAWAGFFYFQPQSHFSEADVQFSVAGDEEVEAGEEVHYRVRYHNSQNVPLSQASLNVRYPAGFEYERSSVDPINEKNNSWSIGTISKQSGNYIDIYGKLYGDIDEEQSLRAFMNYKPANFSSEFQKVGSLSTKISSSPVEVSLSGPDKLTGGAKGNWVINLSSNKIESIEDVSVKINPEGGFRLISSDPESSNVNKYKWNLDKLEDSEQINIEGIFESKQSDKKPKLNVQVYKNQATQTGGYLLAKAEKDIQITNTDVETSLAINGAINDFSVRPGQVLNTSIKLENTGSQPIKDAKVKITFDAPSNDRQAILERSILYWRNIENVKDGDIEGKQINEDTRRGMITWTSEEIPDLAMIKPGNTVNIDFSLPVKDSEVIDLTTYDTYKATAVTDIQYTLGEKRETISTNKLNITINSDAQISVQDTMTTNEEDEKIHNVKWILKNSFHTLEDVQLEADIYGDIEWLEDALNSTVGTAKFDQQNQKITWDIDKLEKGDTTHTLDFATILQEDNPTQTNLTSKVKLKAKDQSTGEEIIVIGDEVLLNKSATSSPQAE